MPYLTKKVNPIEKQLTWNDIINGKLFDPSSKTKRFTNTITRFVNDGSYEVSVDQIISILQKFIDINRTLYEKDRHLLYNKFYIPKAHGGKREINQPLPEMMLALNQLRYILEKECQVLYHTSAFAYVAGRCTRDMNMKHALNESNWFLKTDFKGFFPSINLDFTMQMMSQIFPFSEVVKLEKGYQILRKAMGLAFLDGGLPQGSPVSPCISNLVMIPIDFELFNYCADKRYVYTRYADDITVSCKQAFDEKYMTDKIRCTLRKFNAPFGLNEEKTKYVSNKGPNWVLGLMINKDHHVTVGHNRKKFLKAALCNFIMDAKNGKQWNAEDANELQGQLAYYKMVEKPYFEYVIDHMNKKFHVNVEKLLRDCIAGK